MEIKRRKALYEIKENGVLRKVDKDEYLEYENQMKKEKTPTLCKDCKVTNCRKITLQDIKSDDISDAIRKSTKNVYIDDETKEIIRKDNPEFWISVFECKNFQPYQEKVLSNERKTIKKILEIDEQLFNYEFDSEDSLRTQGIEVLNLQRKRLELLNHITLDETKKQLDNSEQKMYLDLYIQKYNINTHINENNKKAKEEAKKKFGKVLEIINNIKE